MSSDVLAIVGAPEEDRDLLDEIELAHPRRVTILAPGAAADAALGGAGGTRGAAAERLAQLQAAIERRTGAIVVGLAGSREQLRGWRFDRVLSAGALRTHRSRHPAALQT